jgi:hypothetical protein
MRTSRTLAILVAALTAIAASTTGCAADTGSGGEAVGEAEGEIGAEPSAAGIKDGSPEAEGILLLVNDRSVTADILKTRAKLTASVAKGITEYRTGADGKPRWFMTIDELDKLPSTTKTVFTRLAADAKANGYTEAPGFEPPTLAKISVPSNLGRPPTSNDVTVEAGFDGKPAAEAAVIIRGRLTNTVDSSNEGFITRTIKDNHKACTIATGNYFVPGSPHARFVETAKTLGAVRFTLLCTVSAVNPTILLAETAAGVKTYWVKGANGFETLVAPKYPVTIRTQLRFPTGAASDPGQGVRVFYPAWSAKVLTGPTSVIIES